MIRNSYNHVNPLCSCQDRHLKWIILILQLLRMANDVYYVVFAVRKSGIYNSWPECQEQVVGYKGNVYKSYKTFEEARRAWVFYEARVNCTENTSTPNLGEEVNLSTLMEQKGDKGMHWAKHQPFITPFIMGCFCTIVFMWRISKI